MTKFELVEKIISKKVDCNDDNYPVYYLSCYGLIEYFYDYLPLIEKLFNDCNFFIENKDMRNLCIENGVDPDTYGGRNLKALSLSGVSFILNPETMKFEVVQKDPKIICSTSGNTNLVLIEFVHETSHILKGLINNINVSDDGKSIAVRSGLFLDMADVFSGYLENDSYNYMFDEIINVFQTSDIMKIIKNIDCSQLPKNVLAFFNNLNLTKLDIPYGYEEYLHIFKPLWNCEYFRDCTFNCIVVGDLAKFEESFNAVVGDEVFGQMSSMLDGLCFDEFDDDEQNEVLDFITDVVSSYVKKVKKKNCKVKTNKVVS